jgi:hypothetical protein
MILRATCDFVGGWHGLAEVCHGVVTCDLAHFAGGHRVQVKFSLLQFCEGLLGFVDFAAGCVAWGFLGFARGGLCVHCFRRFFKGSLAYRMRFCGWGCLILQGSGVFGCGGRHMMGKFHQSS